MLARARFNRLLTAAGLGRPADDALEAEVQAHFASVRVEMGRFIMVCSLVLNVLWFLSDELTMGHLPGAVEGVVFLRVGVAAAGVLALATMWRQPRLDGGRLWLCVAIWLGEFAWFGAGMARIADLSTPWFYILFPLLMTPELLPLGLRRRVIITGLMGAALMVGFVVVRPETAHGPYFPMTFSYLVFSVGVSVAFGQRIEQLTRSAFVQRRYADRAVEALAQERQRLREQVAERTKDLRRLASHLDRTAEAERERIARDLHDDVGQSVSALRLGIAATRRRYARQPEAIEPHLDDLDTLIGRVAEGTCDAVKQLRPRLLDDRGLIEAAEWLVATIARQSEARISLCVAGDATRLAPGSEMTRVASPAAVAGYRVLQEALNNAVRHAGAQSIEVSVTVEATGFTLEVADDGCGLQADGSAGLGLISMRERTHALGGLLTVTSNPGRGTRVRCALPFSAQEGG